MKNGLLSFYKHIAVDLIPLSVKKRANTNDLLILRLDSIGDYILFRNFLRITKESKKFGDCIITLCGNEEWKDLAEGLDNKYVDKFIWVDRDLFWRDPAYRVKKIFEINRCGYDTVLNPSYTREPLYTDSIVRAVAADHKIGIDGEIIFDLQWQKTITDKWYTKLLHIDESVLFEFNKTKLYFEDIIGETADIRKPFIDISVECKSFKITGPYAVLCPGGKNVLRKWSIDNYIAVADYLHGRYSLSSVFVGSEKDRPDKNEMKKINDRSYIINAVGGMNLLDVVGCVQKSSLVISNDTSIAHIGMASERKVIVISNGNHYGRFTECPVSIYDKIKYIYAPGVIEAAPTFEERVKYFSKSSKIDINKASLQTVLEVIDKLYVS